VVSSYRYCIFFFFFFNLAWVLSLSYLAKYLVVSSYRYCIFFSAANLNHQLFVWLSLLGLFFFAAFPSEATPNAATQGAHAFADATNC